ncbi:HTH-type transcriptional regulator BetI [Clostridium homopropionicum DSM 5847]|uniref:HTH-type transcriptional regulator BetI n=1 Tax=Clostridium homopropionicum DSM 5847 TaxID=1121318 RepID=A0A0L6ZBR5_9CLOT|nr:TetR/AcrR family transcriptional regulator [Clostridium homopropionicum]KOA20429.1 HTH-type transcriptional regulator BetI [Clostridium homopropionicum DSM 5847]SFG34629.1 transcriptional regulator, TetR family [Clostridium homopropionicum]
MSRERQLKKQEEIRKIILEAARNIILKEGIQGLSIRKITNAIEYSPAIVYHYFKDKNQIVESIATEGYEKILAAIRSVKVDENSPEKEIEEVFRKYIEASLLHPDEYKAFMLCEDSTVLTKTCILERGISEKSQTMKLLDSCIKKGIEQGIFEPYNEELTAQIIWTSTFGLIIKIILEKDISQEQINRLIDHHFNILFRGIIKRK